MGDKLQFCALLAQYLVDDQASKSIDVELGKGDARLWAAIRSATPVRGYPTVDEARQTLVKWLAEGM